MLKPSSHVITAKNLMSTSKNSINIAYQTSTTAMDPLTLKCAGY